MRYLQLRRDVALRRIVVLVVTALLSACSVLIGLDAPVGERVGLDAGDATARSDGDASSSPPSDAQPLLAYSFADAGVYAAPGIRSIATVPDGGGAMLYVDSQATDAGTYYRLDPVGAPIAFSVPLAPDELAATATYIGNPAVGGIITLGGDATLRDGGVATWALILDVTNGGISVQDPRV